jgi:3-oxoacyl-(acyl-carrier-protein) synthase
VTPIGIGKDAFWAGLLSERSAISKVTRFDTSANKAKHAAEIKDLDILQWFPSHQAKRWDRYTQMSMVGAKLALQDSGLELKDGQLYPRYGISFGTALGGIANAEEEHANFLTQGPKAVSRALALQILGAAGAIECAIALLALENQWLPPTLHFEKADEGVTLDLMPNHGRSAKVSTVMSNAFGFGGADSYLVLQRIS